MVIGACRDLRPRRRYSTELLGLVRRVSRVNPLCQVSDPYRLDISKFSTFSKARPGVDRDPSLPDWDELDGLSPVPATTTRRLWVPKIFPPPAAPAPASANAAKAHRLQIFFSPTKAQRRTSPARAFVPSHLLYSALKFSHAFSTSVKMSGEITHKTING